MREYIILYFQYSFELLYLSNFGREVLPQIKSSLEFYETATTATTYSYKTTMNKELQWVVAAHYFRG